MDDEKKKNVLKLISKEKPPEETPGATPDELIKGGSGQYDNLIMIGWKDDSFKISWSSELTIEEVYLHLDLAKNRLMANMFEF